MTIREAFVAASRRLAAARHPSASPDLDARVLLGYTLRITSAQLLARWSDTFDEEADERFEAALVRRLAGEPVAWITGFKEFLGMDFEVGPGLLVPRPETETLVEAALEGIPGPRVADVCTGTGCVAVGLAALNPFLLEIWAGDLLPLAVSTARRNAARLLPATRTITVVESNLLENLPGFWHLIVSNPPYLTSGETEQRVKHEGWREPGLALDGGRDGLDLIRRLAVQASAALFSGGRLLVEAADVQMDAIGELFEAQGLKNVRFWRDLSGQRRVAGASKP